MKEAAVSGKKFVLEPLPDFYPVVTLVLYFGDTHWKESLHLKDHLKIPGGLEEREAAMGGCFCFMGLYLQMGIRM